MTKWLATTILAAMMVAALASAFVRADDTQPSRPSLKGIAAVNVLVEELPASVEALGLTDESIRADVEPKLRQAGIRVVTQKERLQLPGAPYLYVNVNVGRLAATIHVELRQNAFLERNGEIAPGVPTWSVDVLMEHVTGQAIRDMIKENVDRFVKAWLSVNPKK